MDGYYNALSSTLVPDDATDVHAAWTAMEQEKGDLIDRSVEYARLTIPSICMPVGGDNSEQEKSNVMNGSRVVNFLANKIVGVMFPHDRPFFKVALSPVVEYELAKEIDPEEIENAKNDIMKTSMRIVNMGMENLDMITYRPVAVQATKHLIITGNVVIRRMPKTNKRVEYGVRDFGVRRRIDGTVYDLILRDVTRFDALSTEVQNKMRQAKPHIRHNDTVNLLSRWRYNEQAGKWTYTQAADDVSLNGMAMIADKDFPCIVLTWSLAKGENYGRGAVEDEITAFSTVDVSTTALIDLFGIAADVKFLVNPGSVIDIFELNNSKRGSYHIGNEGDITATNASQQKGSDMQTLANTVEKWERHISVAFLMTTGSVRDAERVTAEEIRFYAQEIESAFGGLYSQLAKAWQQREADWAVRQVDETIPNTLSVKITTGMDALSQEAALTNLQYALSDLALLNGVPEDVRGQLDSARIADFIFANRNLSMGQFTLSQEQIKARQEAEMAAQQQQMQAQAGADASTAAAKEAAKSA